jgi:phage terminase small subunit
MSCTSPFQTIPVFRARLWAVVLSLAVREGNAMGAHKDPKTGMTPKEQRFVQEYLIEPNATRAAREAGYKSPDKLGHQVMQRPRIKAAIARAMKARSKRLEIDSDLVLRRLNEIYLRVTQEVKPALNSKTGKPLRDEHGNCLYTFNAGAALKALELMGKHVDVSAFEEKHSVDISVADLLRRKVRQRQERMRRQALEKRSALDDLPEEA